MAIMTMEMCYPDIGKNSHLPLLKVYAPNWHHHVLQQMPNIKLI